ncbi:MAG: 3-hydroxyacyl-CoA dehydrogenase family protein [Candidatus Binatia bacterium]|nr:3-hydroxyacyl-CoA dehydrogenase family protein [Candidatus Binatia bacterium]
MSAKKIESIGVLGAGQMGLGIAQVAAKAGLKTVLVKATPGDTDPLKKKVEGAFGRDVDKGRMEAADRDAALGRLNVTTDFQQLGPCDLIIESILEDLPTKHDAFGRLDDICDEGTVFSSNTSTLGITEMAVKTKRPDRFLGVHFFNPAPAMKLVEIAPTISTDPDVTKAVHEVVAGMGKTPVLVKDSTGFVVNRLLVPYMIDAMHEWARGTASIQDIDTAMCNGAAHPMGPFTLADFIGLDVVFHMATNLLDEYQEARFAPPPVLRRMMLSGQLGRKTKLGFYDYSSKPAGVNPALTR